MINKSSYTNANAFDTQWLCRYPRPSFVIYDHGNEFTGLEFQELLQSYGITTKPTAVKNPQANSIVERSHMVITNQLRTFDISKENPRVENLQSIANELLQATAWGVRSAVHTTHQSTPGQLFLDAI